MNAIIGQSGGPTVVINQSLVGAVLEARRHGSIGRLYGARHGVEGMLRRDLVDLSRQSRPALERVAATPGAALGSVRKKPSEAECAEILKHLRALDIGYFFYIGGNDSAETAEIVGRLAAQAGHPVAVFHIPKTIDNDLRETDHCPGFGSAARFVALAFMGDDLDNRSLPGVKINVVMGRHAGFLTAASTLGRARADSGPHLVYVPERPFGIDRFVADVAGVVGRLGRCLVAVSEGIQDERGNPIAQAVMETARDAFGNVQLSGSGALGDALTQVLKTRLKGLRVRADTLGYLQRSFTGVVSPVDAREARQAGALAVRWAARGAAGGSVSLVRESGPRYRITFALTPLEKVARVTRSLPQEFLNAEGNDVTPAFAAYARPLIGPLPKLGFLEAPATPGG